MHPTFPLDDPRFERDNCGVGFAADVQARRSHALLRCGLTALSNLAHRGAVSADGLSGDGAGILTQIPKRLIRRALPARDAATIPDEALGVAMVFLPQDGAGRIDLFECICARELARVRCRFLARRPVPVDPEHLGPHARATLPLIQQIIFAAEPWSCRSAEELERDLYFARRRIQKAAADAGLEPFHICSMSARTVVYKGLIVPSRLAAFYADLRHPDYETALVTFHQRFSTNTLPSWPLAQPFRMLAHNGEINTLRGNLLWAKARERILSSPALGEKIADLFPIVVETDSDSATLDRVCELLVRAGRDPLHALTVMVPEPYDYMPDMDDDVRAMFEHHAAIMEPWEGPAATVATDGVNVAASLDRNGLRPFRYWLTRDDLLIGGSEAGILPVPAADVAERGRLGPGGVLNVDLQSRRFVRNDEIKRTLAHRYPYRAWCNRTIRETETCIETARDDLPSGEALVRLQRAFGYGREDLEVIIGPMAAEAKPPTGSMGDDTPLAALSARPQPLYRYFKQCFAQVTNPALDSLRERLVMTLDTLVGPRPNPLDEVPEIGPLLRFRSPVVGAKVIDDLLSGRMDLRAERLETTFEASAGSAELRAALDGLCENAERAVRSGAAAIILSDRAVDADRTPVPMLLAVSAVHQRLIEQDLRGSVALIAETGEAREDHHFACLIGCGASLVHPWLALASLREIQGAPEQAESRYAQAVDQGLLKIMARMGICSLDSYRGARLFEAIGLDREVIDPYFPNVPCRINGVGLNQIARDVIALHADAFAGEETEPRLTELGLYRYRKNGEHHAFNPSVFKLLHKAVRSEDAGAYEQYARAAETQPLCNLRDLLEWKPLGPAIPLEQVEPPEAIARRFSTQAMSLGSLSPEAHELMSVAMNRLGARSNSGEGGEDPQRFTRYSTPPVHHLSQWKPALGDSGNSSIKQIASGRFGVTARYLRSAREIEIKIAQGAKPGEGGQIPGYKVVGLIARLRGAAPGTTLISPPPHHDIYSIEDLEQLIYDLKRVNPEALVTVKLVALAGIGTIAAGVAKAYADCIQVSGHDGGTGASPVSSIRHAGLPWELGLAEVQQVLVRNDLWRRVALRVDGGLRTGRDVLIAALLGAEQFGFGTAALIASGCVMARQCHSNTCPVGVATQREDLRAKFPGRPEHVVRFMLYVASQVRMLLASMGARTLDQVIGRADLLAQRPDAQPQRAPGIDLLPLLAAPAHDDPRPRRRVIARNDRPEPICPLDERVYQECRVTAERAEPFRAEYPIDNRQRSVGARLAGHIALARADDHLPDGLLQLRFHGVAGQSFGAFCTRGMALHLAGEAQDYVGKSMDGGRIVIAPPRMRGEGGKESPTRAVALGNTVLYGATGGALFAGGAAGERLAVRNSGALAVVEGCGDHACEYMTGGAVVILGPIGRNLGAGMSGGRAYVLDPPDYLSRHVNTDMVAIRRVAEPEEQDRLFDLITLHSALTRSRVAVDVLRNWAYSVRHFWLIAPRTETAEQVGLTPLPVVTVRSGAIAADRRRAPEPNC